jgi:hypothetical protein
MENTQENNEIEFEQYECLRINHEDFSLLYYPSLKILNVLYFDIEEDDEVEDTVWTEQDGFFENKFDRTILQSDLDFMRSYK